MLNQSFSESKPRVLSGYGKETELRKKICFAENLRNLRRGMGMTQKQLAVELEVDQRTISAWEHGICEPSFELLSKLCEVFDETFDGILT